MKPTFTYQKGEGDEHVTFYAHCGSPAEATQTKSDIQTLCDTTIEQDEDMIYVLVDPDRLDEAITELEKAGYSTQDESTEVEDYEDTGNEP